MSKAFVIVNILFRFGIHNIASLNISWLFFVAAVKPSFLRGPRNTVSLTDRKVEFECEVAGDPSPEVTWRRLRGPLPEHRSVILEDKTLR